MIEPTMRRRFGTLIVVLAAVAGLAGCAKASRSTTPSVPLIGPGHGTATVIWRSVPTGSSSGAPPPQPFTGTVGGHPLTGVATSPLTSKFCSTVAQTVGVVRRGRGLQVRGKARRAALRPRAVPEATGHRFGIARGEGDLRRVRGQGNDRPEYSGIHQCGIRPGHVPWNDRPLERIGDHLRINRDRQEKDSQGDLHGDQLSGGSSSVALLHRFPRNVVPSRWGRCRRGGLSKRVDRVPLPRVNERCELSGARGGRHP